MYTQTKKHMEQGRTGENLMQRVNQQQQPPRRRPENQMAAQNHHHQPPPPPQKCPRCDSSNTKFCYYNNYSLSQPRYFCKACRRYWTDGGTLRNVPVGGGCRKGKRPKPQISSSSSTGEIARTEAALPPQNNLTGQALRAPIMPSMANNNSFYTGGAFLSSLAAIHSLSAGINHAAATANFGAGAGNSQYDANMSLFQNLQSFKPHIHHQAQNEIFPSQQSLNIPTKPALNSWTQSFIRGSAGPSSSFWSRVARDGENQAGSNSFNPNQWPADNNNNSGFDPSR